MGIQAVTGILARIFMGAGQAVSESIMVAIIGVCPR
jgi:hypothetical protein